MPAKIRCHAPTPRAAFLRRGSWPIRRNCGARGRLRRRRLAERLRRRDQRNDCPERFTGPQPTGGAAPAGKKCGRIRSETKVRPSTPRNPRCAPGTPGSEGLLPHRDVDGLQGMEPRACGHIGQTTSRRKSVRRVDLQRSALVSEPGVSREQVVPGTHGRVGWKARLLARRRSSLHVSTGKWANICRFDGGRPRMGAARTRRKPRCSTCCTLWKRKGAVLRTGSITSAACFAWNNCWFFGTYGTVVHWDGSVLTRRFAESPGLAPGRIHRSCRAPECGGRNRRGGGRRHERRRGSDRTVAETAEWNARQRSSTAPTGMPSRRSPSTHRRTHRSFLPDRPRGSRLRLGRPGLGGGQPGRAAAHRNAKGRANHAGDPSPARRANPRTSPRLCRCRLRAQRPRAKARRRTLHHVRHQLPEQGRTPSCGRRSQ